MVSFHPTHGPIYGGTIVTVVGVALVNDSDCLFGALTSVARTVAASSEIVCQTPPQAAAVVSLEVTTNLQDYTRLTLPFTYYSTFLCCLISVY